MERGRIAPGCQGQFGQQPLGLRVPQPRQLKHSFAVLVRRLQLLAQVGQSLIAADRRQTFQGG